MEIKFYDNETLLLESATYWKKILDYAVKHNFNVRFTDAYVENVMDIINKFQMAGFKTTMIPVTVAHDAEPVMEILFEKKEIISVQEYNEVYLPKMDIALAFLNNLDHTLYKVPDREETLKQLEIIGWSEEVVETVKAAMEAYKRELYERFK